MHVLLIDFVLDPAAGNATATENRGLIGHLLTEASSCNLPDNNVYTGYFKKITHPQKPQSATNHMKKGKTECVE